MSLVVLDTDAASTLLRRCAPDSIARRLAGQVPAITFVTFGELTKWTLVRKWGPRSLEAMRTTAAVTIFAVECRVERTTGNSGVIRNTTGDVKALVGHSEAFEIAWLTGLRRRERRFESCRGHDA